MNYRQLAEIYENLKEYKTQLLATLSKSEALTKFYAAEKKELEKINNPVLWARINKIVDEGLFSEAQYFRGNFKIDRLIENFRIVENGVEFEDYEGYVIIPGKLLDISDKELDKKIIFTKALREANQQLSERKHEIQKPQAEEDKPKYKVLVDDNFHFMDESERYTLGEYETCEEAVEASQRVVDDFLDSRKDSAATADELYQEYTNFGEDPFIVSDDPNCKFSAWEYAEKRCEELFNPLVKSAEKFDSEFYLAGLRVAGFHIEAGACEFENYARIMIEEFGDDVRIYLKSLYIGIYYFPGFDNAGMTDPETVRHINVFSISGGIRKIADNSDS